MKDLNLILKGIKYVCPCGTSGYAEAAKDYIIALYKYYKNIPLSVCHLKFDNSNCEGGKRNKTIKPLIDKKIKYNKLILHCTPEHWPKLIEKFGGKDIEIIGMTVWETDKLHPDWVKWINLVDKVIVPCTWNKKVFINSGVTKPIEVIPHIYKSLPKIKCKIEGIEKGDFVFYTIGQWTERKGTADTIKVYLNTFTKKDKVCLIVKTFKDNYNEDQKEIIRQWVQNIIKQYSNPAKIILITNELSDDQMAALHHLGNVYFSLCKSEGFGLGMFDAAGLGNPVIGTNYGGQTDFLRLGLIDYKLIPVTEMEHIPWYLSEQNWAQPDLEQASQLMKEFYKHYNTTMWFAEKQRDIIIKNFNMKSISNKLTYFLIKKNPK